MTGSAAGRMVKVTKVTCKVRNGSKADIPTRPRQTSFGERNELESVDHPPSEGLRFQRDRIRPFIMVAFPQALRRGAEALSAKALGRTSSKAKGCQLVRLILAEGTYIGHGLKALPETWVSG